MNHAFRLVVSPASVLILAAAMLLLAPPGIAAPTLEEGEWEFTMTLDGPTMPVAIPPVRFTNCLTKRHPIPKQGQQLSKECKMIEQTASGNTVDYILRCTSNGTTLESAGRAQFSGATMSGTVKQTMKQGGKVMHTATATMTGKRVGACKGKK